MQTTAATAARTLELPIDDLLILQSADTRVIAAAARGDIDLNALAREELANRGFDHSGRWVGFSEARRQTAAGSA